MDGNRGIGRSRIRSHLVTILLIAQLLFISMNSNQVSSEETGSNTGSFEETPTRTVGTVEWYRNLKDCEGFQVSTPVLVDLDLDLDLEIVALTSNGYLSSLRPDGGYFWQDPFTDREIDIAGLGPFNPPDGEYIPPFFSSPLGMDIILGDTPEVVYGTRGGYATIGADGEQLLGIDVDNSTVISTPGITDMFNPGPDKIDMEIAVITEDFNGSSYLELYEVDGTLITRSFIGNMSLGSSTAVVVGNLDPDNGAPNEIFVTHPNEGFRSYKWNFTRPNMDYLEMTRYYNTTGYQASTPVIANMSGGPEKEIVISTNYYEPVEKTVISVFNSQMMEIGTYEYNSLSYSSPVVSRNDLDPLLNDSERDIILTTHDGMVHIIEGYDPDGALDLKYSYDTGGTILSSPAIFNDQDDNEYEFIVATAEGKVFCFDSDLSDNKDIQWFCDLGTEIGISSPVVADIDLDGIYEALIGDTNGTIYCIEAGLSLYTGKQDWPTFHGNVQRTGDYEPTNYHGVYIYPKEDTSTGVPIEIMRKKVHPGSVVTYNLTVKNTGSYKWSPDLNSEIIYITTGPIPAGWKAFIDTPNDRGNDNPGYIRLGDGQSGEIQLLITAPWDDEINKVAEIDVICTSKSGPTDSIRSFSILDQIYDHEVNFQVQPSSDPLDPLIGTKWNNISPGSYGLYTVSILNKGNVNDTFNLNIDPPPTDAGWNWSFVETGTTEANIALVSSSYANKYSGISGRNFTIKVTTPVDVLADSQMILRVRSAGVDAREKEQKIWSGSDTIILVISNEPAFEMIFLNETVYPDINGNVENFLFITNTGNRDLGILLSYENSLADLSVNYPSVEINVGFRQTKEVRITVSGWDSYESIGERITIPFSARFQGNESFVNSSFDVEIVRQSTISLNIIPGHIKKVEPGGILYYELELENMGNSREIFDLTHLEEPGENDFELRFDGEEFFEPMEISKDDVIYTNLSVKIDSDIPLGDHWVYLKLATFSGFSIVKPIHIEVLSATRVRILSKDGTNAWIISAEPGSQRILELAIQNTGNYPTIIDYDIIEGFYKGSNRELSSTWEISYLKFWRGELRDIYNIYPLKTDTVDVSRLDDGREYPFVNGSGGEKVGFLLEQHEKVWIQFMISIPHHDGLSLVRSRDMFFKATSRNSSIFEIFPISINVLYADLEIMDGTYFRNDDGTNTDTFRNGENVTVFLGIINTGTGRARDSKVDLFLDGKDMGGYWIGALEPGVIRKVNFTFGPVTSDHILRIEIDSDNDVLELNDQYMEFSYEIANVREFELILMEENANEKWSAPLWFVTMNIAIILMITVLIINISRIGKKRRKAYCEE